MIDIIVFDIFIVMGAPQMTVNCEVILIYTVVLFKLILDTVAAAVSVQSRPE